MPYSVEGKLVVAISSRALFDFEDENRVFEREGEDAYIALQFARLDDGQFLHDVSPEGVVRGFTAASFDSPSQVNIVDL